MKRLLTILFLCCCISMYGQNGKQKNDQEIKDAIFSMTPEQAEETANQFNARLDEAGIYGYRVIPEDILKVFGRSTINKLRKIGYTGTIMKNGKGKYDLRPIQNFIGKKNKKRKEIKKWIEDANNCYEQLYENINPDDSEKTISRKKEIKLLNSTLAAKYEEVKKREKELGFTDENTQQKNTQQKDIKPIQKAENALKNSPTEQDLENLKTELINACNGNCITN